MSKGPTLKQLAERFKNFDRKKLDSTWGAIHRKREQLGNTRFGSSDPRWKSVDRLSKASSAVRAATEKLSAAKSHVGEQDDPTPAKPGLQPGQYHSMKRDDDKDRVRVDKILTNPDGSKMYQNHSHAVRKELAGMTSREQDRHLEGSEGMVSAENPHPDSPAAEKKRVEKKSKEKAEQGSTETGPRGGTFYVSASGAKVYVK